MVVSKNNKELFIKQRVAELSNKLSNASYNIAQAEITIKQTSKEVDDITHQMEILAIAKQVVQEMIATFSLERIKKLESIVTKCLQTVFFDKELSFRVDITDSRNKKAVNFFIVEQVCDNEYVFPLTTTAVAGGILVVTSFILQIYFIKYFKLPPMVFLDEAFSQVSDQYIPYLNQLLSGLKEAYGLIVVLITHDPRFSELAERTYDVNNGVYSLANS